METDLITTSQPQEITNLIIIKQLPIIEENLKILSDEINEMVNRALSMACTEETVKSVKATRASLNQKHQELEEQRKTVKKSIMQPYEEFEKIYKKYVSDKFENADNMLKKNINSVENELKNRKKDKIKPYFDHGDSIYFFCVKMLK